MSVRKYTENDLYDMTAIWNEIVKEGLAFPQEELLDEHSAREFFASQSHCGVIHDQSGKLAGLYILHPNNIGRCSHICNASYAVDKNKRGKGLGEKLVQNSLKTAKLLGFQIIQFNAVVKSNTAAHKLYNKLGFQPLGTISEGFRKKDGSYEDIQLYWRKL